MSMYICKILPLMPANKEKANIMFHSAVKSFDKSSLHVAVYFIKRTALLALECKHIRITLGNIFLSPICVRNSMTGDYCSLTHKTDRKELSPDPFYHVYAADKHTLQGPLYVVIPN